MIDRETVQRIKDTADIVEVVSDYVHLTRRGANYMGLCPFHNERTPSFSVNKRKNFCYCFSCHKGGSPVNFIMEKEGISYHDALLQLAAKYGIEVQERELNEEEKQRQSERDAMFTANEWAMRYLEKNLYETEDGKNIGLKYFYERGLTDDAIKAFHLGYSLDKGNALVNSSRIAGYNSEILQKLGLLGVSQKDQQLYDRFRGRIMFPIFTSSGKVVAFGGRTLKGEKSKYINSPESEIYKKSNELYGLYQAKNAIVRMDKCFLVEGYMDVIGMWQCGMQNVLASSGTALTDGQIALIHRFTSNITILYDGDKAGINAALRGIDMLLSHHMNVKVLLLPDGHDPDSFARIHTPEEFQKFVEEHETDIIRFKTRVLMEQSANDPRARSSAIYSIVQSLACIPDTITRNEYIKECSSLLGVDRQLIASETLKASEIAVQNARKAREIERLRNQRQQEGQQINNANNPSKPHEQQPIAVQKPKQLSPAEERLHECEKEVLRYCVKYGLLFFCEEMDDNGNPMELNVCEFVDHEIRLDEISFTDPIYARTFELALNIKTHYAEELSAYVESLEQEMAHIHNKKIEEISRNIGTIEDMQRQEQIANEEVTRLRQSRLMEYFINFPGKVLASHEEDDVRRVSTELLTEKYHLSRIYTRQGSHIPTESERLMELLPRAVMEWKEAVLEIRLSNIRNELVLAQEREDTERISILLQQLNSIMQTRSNLAREIGDRIISAIKS